MARPWLFLPLSLLLGCSAPAPTPPKPALSTVGRLHPQLAALLDRAFHDRLLLLYLYPDSLSFRYKAIVMPFATKRVLEHRVPDEVAATAYNTVFLYTGRGSLGPRPASFNQLLHTYDQRLDKDDARPISPKETRHFRLEGTRWVVDSLARTLIPLVEEAPPPPPPRLTEKSGKAP